MTGQVVFPPAKLIVLDGNDGCGKSTLAAAVARCIGAVVAKPYADMLAVQIDWLCKRERFDEADRLARSSIERILSESESEYLVFDRHWATMFLMMPEDYRERWAPLPPTIMCRAETATIMTRLRERGELTGYRGRHDYVDEVFRRLAHLAPAYCVLDTTGKSVGTSLAEILTFLSGLSPRILDTRLRARAAAALLPNGG